MRVRTRALVAAAVTLGLTVGGVDTGPVSAAPIIQLGRIRYDSPGSPDNASNLNGETVAVRNVGTRTVTLTGWTLRDTADHEYRFGTFQLAAGKTVVVHTGSGTNSAGHRYWGLRSHVWNNTGDTAVLRTAAGTFIDRCTWPPATGSGYKDC